MRKTPRRYPHELPFYDTLEKAVRHIPWRLVNEKDGCEMVLIPGGEFSMGSETGDQDAGDDEKPRHRHRLWPYYLGLSCVTVGQYRKFVRESRYRAGSDWQNGQEDHPVCSINWHDAETYARWAGLRLPTEPEWELATRGYEGFNYPWGQDWQEGRHLCWEKQRELKRKTSAVQEYPNGVSPFGICQMSGNVWEWCADWYDGGVYKKYAMGDFRPPATGDRRVLRGGSWKYSGPWYFRGAYRFSNFPAERNEDYGFRLALSLPSYEFIETQGVVSEEK